MKLPVIVSENNSNANKVTISPEDMQIRIKISPSHMHNKDVILELIHETYKNFDGKSLPKETLRNKIMFKNNRYILFYKGEKFEQEVYN